MKNGYRSLYKAHIVKSTLTNTVATIILLATGALIIINNNNIYIYINKRTEHFCTFILSIFILYYCNIYRCWVLVKGLCHLSAFMSVSVYVCVLAGTASQGHVSLHAERNLMSFCKKSCYQGCKS